MGISIHTPAKGVTTEGKTYVDPKFNFNPHSRKGSDACPDDTFVDTLNISIHTPAKGVTVKDRVCFGHTVISIHTPAKGVT